MRVSGVLANMAVTEFARAVAWYELLLGRVADSTPMAGLAEWRLLEGGWIQVFHADDRAGSSWVTLAVASLDEQIAYLSTKRIPVRGTTRSEYARTATVTDPDGNHVTFAEARSYGR